MSELAERRVKASQTADVYREGEVEKLGKSVRGQRRRRATRQGVSMGGGLSLSLARVWEAKKGGRWAPAPSVPRAGDQFVMVRPTLRAAGNAQAGDSRQSTVGEGQA